MFFGKTVSAYAPFYFQKATVMQNSNGGLLRENVSVFNVNINKDI